MLGGTLPSTGASPVDAAAADGAVDISHWTAIANFTGVSEAGDQAATFALCASGGGPAHTVVATKSTTGVNATQEVDPPTLTTATCPAGSRLIGGGDKVDESVGATGGLQPQQGYHMRGSYPTADAAGTTEAADGATNLTTWTSLVQAGGQNLAAGKHMNLRGFALCAEAPAPVADLALTIDAVPSPAVVGQPVTYTLR